MAKKTARAIKYDYIEECRRRVPDFVKTHYSFGHLWTVQKKHWLHDIWRLPFNCLWAVPYISLKKTAESVDKLGWPQPLQMMEHCPSGFKTSLQNYFENKMAQELFQIQVHNAHTDFVKKELKKYAQGRAVVANLSTSFTTLVLGWFIFNESHFGIFNLFNHLSEYFARDRSASNFIFGKSVGKAFYGVVKPEVTFNDIMLSVFILTIFLTVVASVSAFLYAPLRKKLGLEEKKLNHMINEIEDHMILNQHKT